MPSKAPRVEEKGKLLAQLGRLLRSRRWAALATVDEQGEPHASMVAYACEPGFDGILLHLSALAAHTSNLLKSRRGSLAVSELDTGRDDPQLLARASLQGKVKVIPRESEGFARARTVYLERLPDAERLFGFSDFVLFRLVPEQVRYVGGFAQARSFSHQELQKAWTLTAGKKLPDNCH